MEGAAVRGGEGPDGGRCPQVAAGLHRGLASITPQRKGLIGQASLQQEPGGERAALVSKWWSRPICCRAKKLSRAESEGVDALWGETEDHSNAMSRRTVGSIHL